MHAYPAEGPSGENPTGTEAPREIDPTRTKGDARRAAADALASMAVPTPLPALPAGITGNPELDRALDQFITAYNRTLATMADDHAATIAYLRHAPRT